MSDVPRLNLAPKRRKPLSLRNPLDYLQLLVWVFFFPQALRWYVETFGEGKGLDDCKDWAERRQWWKNASIQRNLWLQGLLLVAFTPLCIIFFLSRLDVVVGMVGISLGATTGIIGGTAFAIASSNISGLVGGIAYGIVLGITFGVTFGVVSITALGTTAVTALGIALGVSLGVSRSVRGRFALVSATGLVGYSVVIGFVGGFAIGATEGFSNGIVLGAVGSGLVFISLVISIARLEVWLAVNLFGRPLYRRKVLFSHTTPIPVSGLAQQISSWLAHDWVAGVENIHELTAYTQQLIPITSAINQSLSKLPNDLLLLRVSQLATDPFDWDVVQYASVSLRNTLAEQFIESFPFPPSVERRLTDRLDTTLRIDTPARAAATGFWCLYKGHPDVAALVFSRLQQLPHGREMQQLSQGLSIAISAEQLNDISLVTALNIPNSPLLRADTWPVISRLRSVVDDAQMIYQSYSRPARSLALNRALGKLTDIAEHADRIPLAERQLIVTIAESWREKLLAIATDIGEETPSRPVVNPYVAGDPVEGDLFVGRGEVIKQLEELWLMGNQLQSVVLYGHRRMGKTSILKNISQHLGSNIQVAYVNLLSLGAVSKDTGEGEVLIALSDAISNTLSIAPPKDEDLLRLPSATFRRFIQSISRRFKKGQGLIIALDEFEKIEELITLGTISKDFLGFLRGILQEEPNVAFAFAGLHTLEEMTEDYFNPLFASVLPIRVGFFSIGETRQLLANPDEDFTLDYLPDTLNEIYRLTAGQPYLTQLLGFQLVRRYNHQMFDQGHSRDPIFTLEDLNTVIYHTDFFAKGRYYFTGVWNQAAQDTPGQQEILKALATEADGLSASTLRRRANLSTEEIESALKTLERHDVVSATEDRWKIIVPLFRQWVSEHQ